MNRKLLYGILTVAISLTLALILSEFALRRAGYEAPQYRNISDEAAMFRPDPVLGWSMHPGSHVIRPYLPGGKPIHMTYQANGDRITGPDNTPLNQNDQQRPQLLLIGGSFTQGLAISDDETFAWLLQQTNPGWEVKNFAVTAYGAYQSLLMLERVLPSLERPKIVLYGFIQHHEVRNVSPVEWLRDLTYAASADTVLKLPFASSGADGQLLRHEPEQYVRLPFRDSLSIVPLVEYAIMRSRNFWIKRDQPGHKESVMEKILLEMKQVSNTYGAKMAMVTLSVNRPEMSRLMSVWSEHDIMGIHCALKLDESRQVPGGDGHPNHLAHSAWANCINAALAQELRAGL